MLNASGMLGQIDRTPPTRPGTPVIHLKAEDFKTGGGVTWANSGSGGATYNGTWSNTVSAGGTLNGFDYADTNGQLIALATEYTFPSQCLIGIVTRMMPASGDLFVGTTHASSGWRINSYAYQPTITNSAGVTEYGSAGGYSSWVVFLFNRTGATAAEFFMKSTSRGTVTLSGTYYGGKVLGGWNRDIAEFIVYPSNAVSPTELNDYFLKKFALPP